MPLEIYLIAVAVVFASGGQADESVDSLEAFQALYSVCEEKDCPRNYDAGILNITSRFIPRTQQPLIKKNQVQVFAELTSIIDVDEKAESITTSVMLYEAYIVAGISLDTWVDAVGNSTLFLVDEHLVWRPDTVIYNRVGPVDRSFERTIIARYDNPSTGALLVFVIFASPVTITTRCQFDVKQFPFDRQNCNIDITNFWTSKTRTDGWGFTLVHTLDANIWDEPVSNQSESTEHVGQERNDLAMNLDGYQENSQWILDGVSFEYFDRKGVMPEETELYSSVRYTIKMRRRPRFFLFTLIIPCSLLSMLTVLSVFLPVDSGEKISMGITLMLAQIVNLLILSGLLPESSLSFPALGVYFLTTIGIIAIVYNTVIIAIYYDGDCSVAAQFRTVCLRKTTRVADFNSPTDGERQDGGERKALCKLLDRVFGSLFLVLILVLHVHYFGEHCYNLMSNSD